MSLFFLQRLLQGLVTILIVSLVVFLFMHLAGDPVTFLLPEEATPADIAAMRSRLGLDRPLYEQYFYFMRDFMWTDSIKPFTYSQPLRPLILEGLGRTLVLAGGAMLASIIISVPLGTLAAIKRGSLIDVLIRLFAVFGQSLPSFWVAIMLVLIFAVQLRLFPVSGLGVQNAVLPLATLTIFQVAVLLRLFRSEVLEAINQDYVRTARAKGLGEITIINRHIMKNAALPVLTMTGLQLSNLILGAVVVEPIFAWPGLGYLMVNAVFVKDYPIVVAGTIVAAVFVTAINLAVDLAYGGLDPRIRVG